MNNIRIKRCLIWLIMIALAITYFCVFFAQGFWHNHTFLYKTDDSTFKSVAGYVLKIRKAETQADIVFTANGVPKQYQVIYKGQPLQILEDEQTVYTGSAVFDGDRYYLEDENGELILNESHIGSKDAYPSYTELLNWALADEPGIHGNLIVLLFLGIALILLSISFVRAHLRFRKTGLQSPKIIRISLSCAVVVLAVLSLVVH